jgi:hypothetical protein
VRAILPNQCQIASRTQVHAWPEMFIVVLETILVAISCRIWKSLRCRLQICNKQLSDEEIKRENVEKLNILQFKSTSSNVTKTIHHRSLGKTMPEHVR